MTDEQFGYLTTAIFAALFFSALVSIVYIIGSGMHEEEMAKIGMCHMKNGDYEKCK